MAPIFRHTQCCEKTPVPRTKGTPTSAVVHRPMVEHAFEDGDIDIETKGEQILMEHMYIYI